MIGGPNGAGKTTASMVLLPKYLEVFEFVNADEIAHGINPLRSETAQITAGRIMIERINDLINTRKSFAFETTCAGQHHLETLQKCRDAGYTVNLVFYWLPSEEMAIQRVKYRVQQGGHDIPEATIRRRYKAGLHNLIHRYLPMVDTALVLDNSNTIGNDAWSLIAEKTTPDNLRIINTTLWQHILVTAA